MDNLSFKYKGSQLTEFFLSEHYLNLDVLWINVQVEKIANFLLTSLTRLTNLKWIEFCFQSLNCKGLHFNTNLAMLHLFF